MKSVEALVELDEDSSRYYCLPADGTPSLLYVFGREQKLGARAYCDDGCDFAPGTSHERVRLDFWADDEWTDVVVPGAAFTIWYGSDVGRGVVRTLR